MTEGVLLEDGHWTLEKMAPYGNAQAGVRSKRSHYVSIVKHVCYPNGRLSGVPGNVVHQVVAYPEDSTYCWRCSAKIPDSMVACWKFQNWEAMNRE